VNGKTTERAATGRSGPNTQEPRARDALKVATTPATTVDRSIKWPDVRARAGLSLRDFEHLTGINRGEISKIEHGLACPTPLQALRLLMAAGLVE
jgi:hypothetical protein